LVRFACLSADRRHAGRGGLGAVMGSKRLKAIVVGGDVETPIADPDRVRQISTRLRERAAGAATAKYRELGTIGNLLTFDRLGVLPTRNFQQSHFEQADQLSGERLHGEGSPQRHKSPQREKSPQPNKSPQPGRSHRRASCASCTIGCEHRYGFASADDVKGETRVEYESLFALGPLCGIGDPDVVLGAVARCDELGIDTISAGGTLAFAMECGERGLLEGGPRFGEPEALLGWIDRIARREGLGDRLAEGSLRLARSIGRGAIAFAPQVKGLELPGYEPRSLQTLALGLAVGTRGADHNRSGAYEADFSEDVDRLAGDDRSARRATETEDRAALLDSLILCKFLRGTLDDFYPECAELLAAVVGHPFTGAELRIVARRIVGLRKAYNVREGWQPADDTLPDRFLTEALESGPARGARLPRARLASMIRSYNLERGWSDDGFPTLVGNASLFAGLSLPPAGGLAP
jgi:aldehyde:ferredoxin oxidoreductase